jgi:S-adenosylmethionine synthetase
VADQISDAVLDAVLTDDPMGRVACETLCTTGLVVVGGEITTKAWVDVPAIVRKVITEIGYVGNRFGFDGNTCGVLNAVGRQSPDIAQGVDTGGAGDQGLMVGYACDETPELMPTPISLAHKLTRRLAELRKKNLLKYLGPDGKSQVTVEYDNGRPVRVDAVVLSTQHDASILDGTGRKITNAARDEMIHKIILPVLPKGMADKDTKYFVNPTGKFVVGGPVGDTGVTGRKIIVDTYGGWAPHGGGAFSGKDPSKVDRSACYMARHVAKNIVAAQLAAQCTVQLAYAIGVAEPVSVMVDTHGTGRLPSTEITELVRKTFPLTPRGIIEYLKLRRPIFRKTASYGHFGREDKDFLWESTNKAAELKKKAGV